jgi:uncharacterized membrane protein
MIVDVRVGYAWTVRGLWACPFCREMYQPGEAKACTVCDVALVRVEALPKDASAPEAPPEDAELPWLYMERGRGWLLGIGVLGLLAFFAPWVHDVMPEKRTLSGLQLAEKLGWLWAPFIAWLVLIPLVLSRRSIRRMRGARVAVAFLSAMSLLTVIVRVVFVPASTRLDPRVYSWGFGLYATAFLALAALLSAWRFGGRIDDLPAKGLRPPTDTLH